MELRDQYSRMVKVYDNILSDDWCDKLISIFESSKNQEYLNHNHTPCFTQLNIRFLRIVVSIRSIREHRLRNFIKFIHYIIRKVLSRVCQYLFGIDFFTSELISACNIFPESPNLTQFQ